MRERASDKECLHKNVIIRKKTRDKILRRDWRAGKSLAGRFNWPYFLGELEVTNFPSENGYRELGSS